MKSAYEIAMEKMLAETRPTRKLSDEEKKRCAEIDKTYGARIAETELLFESRIAEASSADVDGLNKEMASEIARLEEARETEKEKIWEGKDG